MGILRLCMFLFSEADENIFIARNKKRKYYASFGYQKRTVSTDTINIGSKEVSKWSSELLFCHKHFIALSPIIKMAKCLKMKIFPQGQIHKDLVSCLKGMGLSHFYSQKLLLFSALEVFLCRILQCAKRSF